MQEGKLLIVAAACQPADVRPLLLVSRNREAVNRDHVNTASEHATPRVRVIGGRKRSLSRSIGPVHGRSGGKRLAETSCANVLLERPDNYSP